jgi:UDP-glucose 4-epimerase
VPVPAPAIWKAGCAGRGVRRAKRGRPQGVKRAERRDPAAVGDRNLGPVSWPRGNRARFERASPTVAFPDLSESAAIGYSGTQVAASLRRRGPSSGVKSDPAACRAGPVPTAAAEESHDMAHCLVTGGAGFIGSHVTQRLLEAGHRVTVLDDLSTGVRDNLAPFADHPQFRFRSGSITDPVLLGEVVPEADVIYHLAAAVGVKLVADDPVRTIETNIYPTEVLLRLAVQGRKKVFLASTSEVYGKNPKERWTEEDDLQFGPTTRPRWAYGCSKAIDEFLALAYHRKYGLPVVIGRFFNVVGPRQVGNYGMVIPRFVDRALDGKPVVVYDDGEQVRCFAHVGEVVDCVIRLMETSEAEGGVFNIGSDEPVSIRRLAEEVTSRIGPRVPIEYLAYNEAYGQDFEDVRRRVPDVSRLERTIGTKPTMPLGEILDDIIRWKRSVRGEGG